MELIPKKYYNTQLEKWTLFLGVFSFVDQILSNVLHTKILYLLLMPIFGTIEENEGLATFIGLWHISWIFLLVIYGASHTVSKRKIKKQAQNNNQLSPQVEQNNDLPHKTTHKPQQRWKKILKKTVKVLIVITILLLLWGRLVEYPKETRIKCNDFALTTVQNINNALQRERDYDFAYTYCLRSNGIKVDEK